MLIPAYSDTILSKNIRERQKAKTPNPLLAALVESAEDAIISKTPGGIITSWNASAERLFGYTSADAIGRQMDILIPPERRDEEKDILAGILAGRGIRNHETVRLHKHMHRVCVSTTVSPIYDDRGKITGISVIDRDISLRKETEHKLQLTTQKLKESNTDLEQFAYACSHELQEPLRMIYHFTECLQKRLGEKLDEKSCHYMQYIMHCATNGRNLVNSLLSLAHVGNEPVPFEKVDCNAAFDAALESLETRIAECGGHVTKDNLPSVYAHPVYITQVLQNLIGNALKFCKGKAPIVHIRATAHGPYWQFSVSDNGIGIAPEYQEKIFQIFQRLHSREAYTGTGIGLYIVKKIIERCDGKIWLESAEGKGAIFYFTLPGVPT